LCAKFQLEIGRGEQLGSLILGEIHQMDVEKFIG
jgi:hypothetical protein